LVIGHCASIKPLEQARRNRLVLVASILGSVIVFVDSTVVNVALPAIQDDLGGGLTLQQWVVDAYLLTLGSLLLVGGSLGDLLGPKRIFLIGVLAFGATIRKLPVGGWLVTNTSWRWIFFVNVPFAIATAGLIAYALPAGARGT